MEVTKHQVENNSKRIDDSFLLKYEDEINIPNHHHPQCVQLITPHNRKES